MSARGLRRGNWSVQELERLRALLPRRGVKDTAVLLRRSAASVYRKAMEIMRVAPRSGAWSAAEDLVLRDAWGVLDHRLLAALVGRSVAQVAARANLLRQHPGTGSWSAAERHRLKEFYGTRSDEDLELCILRPVAEIVAMARELCLAKDKRFSASARRRAGGGEAAADGPKMPRWSAAEVEKLREIYAEHDNLEIARHLGRTVASVANKANHLGLKKSPEILADIGRANVKSRYGRREPGQVDGVRPSRPARGGADDEVGAQV
ncbi:MAG: hypothetical protein NXI31_10005 [bacterium]|nr:hypothetical protein [bacterium]